MSWLLYKLLRVLIKTIRSLRACVEETQICCLLLRQCSWSSRSRRTISWQRVHSHVPIPCILCGNFVPTGRHHQLDLLDADMSSDLGYPHLSSLRSGRRSPSLYTISEAWQQQQHNVRQSGTKLTSLVKSKEASRRAEPNNVKSRSYDELFGLMEA